MPLCMVKGGTNPGFVARTQRFHVVMDLYGGSDGTNRVVFMGLRDAEESHHAVTHHPLDEALIAGNNLFDSGKNATRKLLYLFGVKFFGD